tara:strand:+ start:462 stop:620 length:159 start_codon:yes stop_codon:yes gene_type:complete
MNKKIYLLPIVLFLLSCGGGYSSTYASNQSAQSSQSENITIKNIPQNISIFE